MGDAKPNDVKIRVETIQEEGDEEKTTTTGENGAPSEDNANKNNLEAKTFTDQNKFTFTAVSGANFKKDLLSIKP